MKLSEISRMLMKFEISGRTIYLGYESNNWIVNIYVTNNLNSRCDDHRKV